VGSLEDSPRYELSNTRELLGIQPTRKGWRLGLPCTYMYSFGKDFHDKADLPEGWKVEWIAPSDGRGQRAGFKVAPMYVGENEAGETVGSHEPREGFTETGYAYLVTPEGQIVATWDEGRWWTPRESAEFGAILREQQMDAMTQEIREKGALDLFGLGRDARRPEFPANSEGPG
jgi:hypothetical protein